MNQNLSLMKQRLLIMRENLEKAKNNILLEINKQIENNFNMYMKK